MAPVNDPPVDADESITTLEDTPATGSVLTNATDVEGNPLTVTEFTVGGQTLTAGQTATLSGVGTLVINADGSYTYTRSGGAPGNAQDVFTYTLTDADGDTTTATLTISIGDSAPNLPDPAAVQLDDDALAGGNPGGTNDDADSAGLPGQLSGTGGDGDLTYNFTGLDNLPAGFTANPVDASTVQILQGATVVLTITLDNDTGAFNVVQNNPIDHPAGSDENNLIFSIGVEVEDADGDTEPATITINVDDDTPLAANDTDSIPQGSNGPATGNVITDAAAGDAGDSDDGADTVGADDCRTHQRHRLRRDRGGRGRLGSPGPVWRPDDRCGWQLQLCPQRRHAGRRERRLHLQSDRWRRRRRHGHADDRDRRFTDDARRSDRGRGGHRGQRSRPSGAARRVPGFGRTGCRR